MIYKDLLQMLVDPLSNFYLYYSLEKNDGTAVSERVQVSEACWHSSGLLLGIQAYENCKLV